MELRTYLEIVWRRIWLVILIVGIVALYSGYKYYQLRKTPGALKNYSSSVTIQIGLQATGNGGQNTANYVTVSEALADALSSGPILTFHEFDQAVSNQIGQDTLQIEQLFGPNPDLGDWQNPGAIGTALNPSRAHSLVTISTTWSTPAGAWAIANAVGEVLVANTGTYLDYAIPNTATSTSVQPQVSARIISSPVAPIAVGGALTSKVTLYILLVVVALIISIALAFLLDYLDDRIRRKAEVTRLLGLPIYGEVPSAPAPGHARSPKIQRPSKAA